MASRPHVYVFGAGHVGDALALALSLAPLRVILVDTREDELIASTVPRIETCLTAMPEAVVRDAPAGSSFVILTHDHALDYRLAKAALERPPLAFVGLIGSETKRARFHARFEKEGLCAAARARLTCPIGIASIAGKEPDVIAIATLAQLLQMRCAA